MIWMTHLRRLLNQVILQVPYAWTNSLATDSLLVIRVIKSFSYRVVKNLILPHVDLTTTTVKELKTKIHEGSSTGVLSDSRDTETIRFQTVSDYRLRYVEDLRQSTWI